MKYVIHVMGTDGSGKTTLTKALVARERAAGLRTTYVYARYFPFLSQPLKWASRLFLYRKNSEFRNYQQYSAIKSGFGKRHSFLSRVYMTVCLVDYLLQTVPRFYLALWRSDTVLLDRYVADVTVTLTIASSLRPEETQRILRILHRFLPVPDRSLFIDVDTATAFRRKDDIPSEAYLLERRELYLSLNGYYNIEMIDGRPGPQELADHVHAVIRHQKDTHG